MRWSWKPGAWSWNEQQQEAKSTALRAQDGRAEIDIGQNLLNASLYSYRCVALYRCATLVSHTEGPYHCLQRVAIAQNLVGTAPRRRQVLRSMVATTSWSVTTTVCGSHGKLCSALVAVRIEMTTW
eukprot:SAG25_NODE_322_length_9886_cov_11.794217_14_plen_126_part_00